MMSNSYWGIMGLMAPAMVLAWLDREHASCYLLTDFLFKADLVAAEQEPDLLRVDSVVAVPSCQ